MEYLKDYTSVNRYAVLQLREDNEATKSKMFKPLSELNESPSADDYEMIYFAVNEKDENVDLNQLYEQLNNAHKRPNNYYGYSLSMGDVVVESYEGVINAYYVDRFGYTQLTDFVNDKIKRRLDIGLDIGKEYSLFNTPGRDEMIANLEDGYYATIRNGDLHKNYSTLIVMTQFKKISNDLEVLAEVIDNYLNNKGIDNVEKIYERIRTGECDKVISQVKECFDNNLDSELADLLVDIDDLNKQYTEFIYSDYKQLYDKVTDLERNYNPASEQEKERFEYWRDNFKKVIDNGKINELLIESQNKLEFIYEFEGDLPFKSVSKNNGFYNIIGSVESASTLEADIYKLYTHARARSMTKDEKELFMADYEKGLGEMQDVSYVNRDDNELYAYLESEKMRELRDIENNENIEESLNVEQNKKEQENNMNNTNEEIYTPSSEELTEQQQKREAILRGVGAVMSSEGFANYTNTINKMMQNKFSAANCGRILNQYIERYCEQNKIDVCKISNEKMVQVINEALKSDNVPTYLMGYEGWKQFGRQVKGENVAYLISAPNYVKEYNGKGTIIKAMEKKFNEDFKKKGSIPYSDFTLGKTGLVFRGYGQKGNYLVDICVNNKTIAGKQTMENIRKYLDNSVIGKMINGYSNTLVYDVKNTIVPEHLWVKNGFTKAELVTDEKGKPITRYPYKNQNAIEYKIINTEERKAKFNPSLSLEITGLTEEKATILFEALKEVSNKKGVPMAIETIEGGARGYYHTEQKRIAISDKLDTISMCATAIHEMAHSDLHSMPNTKNRNTKEVEAEAVSYMTSQYFGINTDVKSFNYLAAWSTGRDLKELDSSMSVILNESKKLEMEISAELESRGYTHNLEKVATEHEEQEVAQVNQDNFLEKKENENSAYIKTYKEFVLAENDNIANLKDNASLLLQQTSDERCTEIIKEQIDILNKQKRKVVDIDNKLNELEKITSKEEADTHINIINKSYGEFNELKMNFNSLSYEYVERLRDVGIAEKKSLKDKYNADPINTLKECIASSSDENLKQLSDMDLAYIATSKYLSSNYGKLITTNMESFISKGAERIEHINNVKSKNGQFVEIAFCERWFEKPIFEKGALLHPATANKIIRDAEKDIIKLKEAAKANDEYIPYSKCDMCIYTEKDGTFYGTRMRIDIGDGYQTDLTSYMKENCNDKEVLDTYLKSVRERTKNKIYEGSEKGVDDKNIDNSYPHGEDGIRTTFTAEEMKNFVGANQEESEHTNPGIDHSKQKIHDRGCMTK